MSAALQQERDALSWRLRQLEQQLLREVSGQEVADMEAMAARFNSVAAALGETAPPPLLGELPISYRRRLAAKLAAYSQRFKDTDFTSTDAATLDVLEPQLMYDAREAARLDAVSVGKLVEYKEDIGGRTVTKTVGDPMNWMQHFMIDGVTGSINRTPDRRDA
jgi:hypothetical protein